MPKSERVQSVPKYRFHKATGQAIVTVAGKMHYLGPWKSKASRIEYDRIIAEWLAAGRSSCRPDDPEVITVAMLVNEYRKFARRYYRRADGSSTGTAERIGPNVRLLREYYGRLAVAEFRPRHLEGYQQLMIDRGSSRSYINLAVARVKRMFKWGVPKELVPIEVHQRLTTVRGLAAGRTDARETEAVKPVADEHVEATLPHLPEVVADMVRFQRLTGCRPGEVCNLRPCDVDTGGDVWRYTPESHKTAHHGRRRVILIGPRAQGILRKYLLRDETEHCFRPCDSEKKRRRRRHEDRVTPLSCGNVPGSNRSSKPKRSAGERYVKDSYNRAIDRACVKAGVPKWSPNRLRHTAATEIRKRHGLEAAQVILGHSSCDVTEIYAERDTARAEAVMREVG